MENKTKLIITESDPFDRESDSELDEMLNEEYYPSSEDEESSDEETSDSEDEEEPPKPLERTGVIYRLTAEGCDKVYIGSTVNLKHRIAVHKHYFNKGVNRCSSKLIMEYGNYTFSEIASLIYTDIKQLRRLEADIILEHGDSVVNICGTKNSKSKDYYTNNKEYKIKKQKEYNKKDSAKEYKKKYRTLKYFCNCCKKELALQNKSTHYKTKKHISNSK